MNTLAGKTIVITGGAGLVGSHVAELLLEEDCKQVILYDNFIRGRRENLMNIEADKRLQIVEGDIRDRPSVEKVLEGADYCYHLAALRITYCAENPTEGWQVMFDGSHNVFNACVKHKVKKLVFASSASIYGQAEEFPTSENHHPYNNTTLYGAGKSAGEALLRAMYYRDGLSYNALRFFNVYGPRMDTHGRYTEVLIRWYRLIKENKPPLIFGEGDQTMDFVYIDDIARACLLALKKPVSNEVFNVARGEETSLKQLCDLLLKTMNSGLRPGFKPLPAERSSVEVVRRLADTTKASQLLGFKAEVSLEKGLARLVAWLEQVIK